MRKTITRGAVALCTAVPAAVSPAAFSVVSFLSGPLLPAAMLAGFGSPAYAADDAAGQAADQVPASGAPAAASDTPPGDRQSVLAPITVTGSRSIADKNQLPVTTESVTAAQVAQTINAVNTEDTLKYLPSILVRKRYIGDTQAPMATRTTGINAGARSLVMVDGVSLSSLINNNNGNGSPQWFMVSPQEIERVDVMYGPFSAAYPGNSYGAVTAITTRMPDHFEGTASVTAASQHFKKYGSDDDYSSQKYSATLGDRSGALSWWFSANHLNSFSQPITFGTVAQSTTAAGAALPQVGGGFADRNRSGGAIQVIGAGNLIHTVQDSARLKLAYDFSPTLKASYMLGYWRNDATANSQSYLRDAAGNPYYGGASGNVNIGGYAYSASSIAGQFSSNRVRQEHLMQSLTLGSDTRGPFDWEVVASNFRYLRDLTQTSTGPYPAAQDGGPGRITDMNGTGWSTLDLKGTWRPPAAAGAHAVSFGAHYDKYKLVSPTYDSADWASGSTGALFGNSLGSTTTAALWLQDVWRLAPSLQATVGARYESWRAYDGFNYSVAGNGAPFAIAQPRVDKSGVSPKLSLRWDASEQWSVTGSFGKALRFPTVGELYQSVQTGTTFTQANPFLKPEKVLSGELAIERNTDDSRLRVSLFEEHVADALISQTSTIAGFATPVAFTQNVDKTRQRGIELVAQRKNAFIKGLELTGNLTYVDARIRANGSYVATVPGASSVGKRTPYVPEWRATAVATYRPDDKTAYTLAARYSSRLYATVDNTDVNAATYMGFEGFLVMDARIDYAFAKHWNVALGVDNLNNRQYFLYHPFPSRTVYAELRYAM